MPLEMLLGAASNLLKFADKLGNENKAGGGTNRQGYAIS